jgi:hypothetical protein
MGLSKFRCAITQPVLRDVLRKVRKLAELPEEARQCRFAVSITRLTVLKSLCQEPEAASRFVTYLARKTLERVEQGQGHTRRRPPDQEQLHRQLMSEALAEMAGWPGSPTEADQQRLWKLLGRMQNEQNEHQRIKWGAVRLINDNDLLVFEYAARCLLNPQAAGVWAYQTARQYAERYDSAYGTGLIPASAPLVQDIADFWIEFYAVEAVPDSAPQQHETVAVPKQAPKHPSRKHLRRVASATPTSSRPQFTQRQGQFLAFIHLYRKLRRQGPAELDMVKFFGVTPPSVHGMVVKLEQLGLVIRTPGVARSIRVTIPAEKIPALEDVEGPAW